MNVIFVDPAFPQNQRQFVRALHATGNRVIGVGERPYDWFDDDLKGWLAAYEQVSSVTDEAALEAAVRRVQAREWVDRLEATVEAHVLTTARVREKTGIPGLPARAAWLCRDKVAMKEALREAGVPCAASAGVSSLAEAHEFAEAVGFPLIVKPRSAAGASGTYPRRRRGRARPGPARKRRRRRRERRDRGIHHRPRGFLRYAYGGRAGTPRLYQPLLPERAGGDAHALDQPTDHLHQPHGCGALPAGLRNGAPRHRGARHYDRADAHGVVFRAERIEVLRDRRASTRGRPVGRLLLCQRVRSVSRVGARGYPRPRRG